jgi:hypothetical protein
MPTIEIEVPYDANLGKNRMKGFAHGHYYVQKGYKDAVEGLIWAIKTKGKKEWKQDKVWVDIFFQKPRLRCDVSNLVDGIYDAVKQAIEVDDCYFSGKLDWEWDKEIAPYIVITIRQE